MILDIFEVSLRMASGRAGNPLLSPIELQARYENQFKYI
jgi:hypothetical protein